MFEKFPRLKSSASRSKPLLFIDELKSNDGEYEPENCGFDEYINRVEGVAVVPCSVMYKEYCAWMVDGGFGKPLNKIAFGKEISGEVLTKVIKIEGLSVRFVSFSVDKIVAEKEEGK
eukprot:Lithocolla_globosa_v1_NODE_9356_length_716_cov_272.960666.p1 type:complete len:117 gc:universal NODE_9356_length_716_cov_272.960666:62-412(+)